MAALIAARRADGIPVAVACRALGVSRSWFYQHKDGRLPPRAQRRERLKAEITRLFALHAGRYGSPRITADLREEGWRVSENTVAVLMREQHLAARRKARRKAATRPGKGRAPKATGLSVRIGLGTASTMTLRPTPMCALPTVMAENS